VSGGLNIGDRCDLLCRSLLLVHVCKCIVYDCGDVVRTGNGVGFGGLVCRRNLWQFRGRVSVHLCDLRWRVQGRARLVLSLRQRERCRSCVHFGILLCRRRIATNRMRQRGVLVPLKLEQPNRDAVRGRLFWAGRGSVQLHVKHVRGAVHVRCGQLLHPWQLKCVRRSVSVGFILHWRQRAACRVHEPRCMVPRGHVCCCRNGV
jgi:hypothetical protein